MFYSAAVTEILDISTKHCTVERDGAVVILTMNRPEKKNALSGDMLAGLVLGYEYIDAMRVLWRDPEPTFHGRYTSFDRAKSNPKPAQTGGVPILVGAVLQDGPDNASNTGIVWDPITGPGQRYTKRHLVPFGEYMPLRGLISHLTNLTTLVPQNFLPGHSVGTLQVGPATVADVMCFEVAFDEQVRDGVDHGGHVIVVQTNNATYMHTAETRQQLAMSQLRAIEHGRSVVIAATSGISAVIGPDGRVQAETSELTPAIIDMPVTLRSDRTLADHLGAAPEWLFGILGMVSIVAALVRGRSRHNGDRNIDAETVV